MFKSKPADTLLPSAESEFLTAERDSLKLMLEQARIDAKALLTQAGIDAKERDTANTLQISSSMNCIIA